MVRRRRNSVEGLPTGDGSRDVDSAKIYGSYRQQHLPYRRNLSGTIKAFNYKKYGSINNQ